MWSRRQLFQKFHLYKISDFFEYLRKLSEQVFFEFDLQKSFSASFHRKFVSLFQNHPIKDYIFSKFSKNWLWNWYFKNLAPETIFLWMFKQLYQKLKFSVLRKFCLFLTSFKNTRRHCLVDSELQKLLLVSFSLKLLPLFQIHPKK